MSPYFSRWKWKMSSYLFSQQDLNIVSFFSIKVTYSCYFMYVICVWAAFSDSNPISAQSSLKTLTALFFYLGQMDRNGKKMFPFGPGTYFSSTWVYVCQWKIYPNIQDSSSPGCISIIWFDFVWNIIVNGLKWINSAIRGVAVGYFSLLWFFSPAQHVRIRNPKFFLHLQIQYRKSYIK